MPNIRLSFSLVAALLLAGCATNGSAPSGTTATPTANAGSAAAPAANTGRVGSGPEAAAAVRANDPATKRRRELREMILSQVEPCLREELASIDDPRAVGSMVVFFGFEPSGEAVTAQLTDDALARYEADASYRAVANAIMTGVVECAPLQNMPVDEHDEWGTFPLVFGPLEA